MKRTELRREGTEAGFTLIELMVALVITLIISGAIYGLMLSSQTSFRKEPQLTDRQQNVRVAMNLINQDLVLAGEGIDPFVQIFSQGMNGAGPGEGAIGPTGEAARGDTTTKTDMIQMMVKNNQCPSIAVQTDHGVNIWATTPNLPTCYGLPAFLYVWGTDGPAASQGQPHGLLYGFARGGPGHVNFPPGQAPKYNPPGGPCHNAAPWDKGGNICQFASVINYIEYEVAPDPVDGMPSLWRTTSGDLFAPPDPHWQLIARGIDDLQVQYQDGSTGGNPTLNEPRALIAADYTTIVSKVQITLSARTEQSNLQGAKAWQGNGPGDPAVRGQLVSAVSPRAALVQLTQSGGATPLWK